ncbi:unnamed protein product [Lactuca virosa]|uniref:Protein kinase domain-containing protein n=1 Tax=Lactuca virosa TaxID=75947 RepID=A0AAU9LVA8_9ASTR|nr:unnamed protein product [Lactuca virosa]
MGCFSSKEKRSSRRHGAGGQRGRGPIVPSSPPRVPQPASVNQRRVQAEAKPVSPSKRTRNEVVNNQPPTKPAAGNNNIAAQTFTFRELAAVTKNFRQDSLIGEGGFGRVYKGKLAKTGQEVAVKQLDRNGLQGNREFLVEVLMLSLLHHPNLVNLIGYCADGDQRLLVYEYMSAGSLEDHLLDLPRGKAPLPWYTRMKIALDAAKGLEYLHDKANPPVIYRDLNFGVVLLELITGKRAIDPTRKNEQQNLVCWAEPIFTDPRRLKELADPLLKGNHPAKGFNQAVAVAGMCVNNDASVRPLISDVVTALTFLGEGNEDNKVELIDSPSPTEASRPSSLKIKASASDREKAVAEAMEWGTSSRPGGGKKPRASRSMR